jgi:cell division septal protein FtsQ
MANRKRRKDEYLLEVKVIQEGRMKQRLRFFGGVLALLVVVSLSGYGLYRLAKWTADKLVYANPRFTVTEVLVEVSGGMTHQQVCALAGVRHGMNIFRVDLQQAQRNLEMIPLVRRAAVRRVLPNQLVIEVEEREAKARLKMPSREFADSVFWVDREGMVMKPLQLRDGSVIKPVNSDNLPVLTGVNLADLRVGRKVESVSVYRALELLDQLELSAVSAALPLDRVDVGRPHELVLTTQRGTTVRFDPQDFNRQLRRLGVILSWAAQRQKAVQLVDLTVERGVPVKLAN